jgi:integrase
LADYAAFMAILANGSAVPAPKVKRQADPIPQPEEKSSPVKGTLGALIVAYRDSPAFAQLRGSTKSFYSQRLKRIEADPLIRMPVSDIRRADVVALLDHLAPQPYGWNEMRKVLKNVLNHAVDRDIIEFNVVDRIKKQKVSGEFRMWTDAEMQRFEDFHPPGSRARRIYTIALCTAQRCSDIAALTWDQVADDILRVTQIKTGTPLALPIKEELFEALGIGREEQTGPWVATIRGPERQMSSRTLSSRFSEYVKAAGLPRGLELNPATGKKERGCCLHGLRATAATKLALEGATPHMIKAWTGHKSIADVQRYTKHADQIRLAEESKAMMVGTKKRQNSQHIPNTTKLPD